MRGTDHPDAEAFGSTTGRQQAHLECFIQHEQDAGKLNQLRRSPELELALFFDLQVCIHQHGRYRTGTDFHGEGAPLAQTRQQ